MNERLLFHNMLLLKRWAAEQFTLATQIMYRDHPAYPYRDEEDETEVIILPTFSDTDFPGKKPKILSQGGGYDLSFQDTLGSNFAHEVTDGQGQVIGVKRVKQVRMSMMVLVQAYAEEESSDLADELALLVGSVGRHVYAQKGLAIYSLSVSETNVLNPEEKSFQTVLNIGFDTYISIVETSETEEGGLEIDFGVDTRLTSEPGVRVIPQSRR